MLPEKPYKLLYPMRVCLVSASFEGKDNFMPAAWVCPLSASPVLYGVAIAKQRHTYSMIKNSGCFVINSCGFDLKERLEKFGRSSGKDSDKFKLWGLTREKCGTIPSVSIKECPLSLEMKVVNEYEIGDHVLFVGELLDVKERKKGAKGIYQKIENGYLEI